MITIFSPVNPWEITLWEGRSLQAKTHAETAQNWALQRTVIYFKNGNHSLLQTDSTQALWPREEIHRLKFCPNNPLSKQIHV